jgi:Tol biopolymer transport system component
MKKHLFNILIISLILFGIFYALRQIIFKDSGPSEGLQLSSDISVTPDGKFVIYEALAGKKLDIFELDLKTSAVRKLTFQGNNADPSVSPDGSEIVFSSDRDGQREIFRMTREGQETAKLTHLKGGEGDIMPVFSPDGSQIAFTRYQRPSLNPWAAGQFCVMVLGLDSGDLREIKCFSDRGPQLGRSGLKDPIQFLNDDVLTFAVNFDRFYANIGGGEIQLKEVRDSHGGTILLSPDRQKILYMTPPATYDPQRDEVHYELFAAGAGGKNPIQLTSNKQCNDPKAFFPDGKTALHLVRPCRDDKNIELWMTDLETKKSDRLNITL